MVALLVQDNLDIACQAVEKAAMDRAAIEVDENFASAYEARRRHREVSGFPPGFRDDAERFTDSPWSAILGSCYPTISLRGCSPRSIAHQADGRSRQSSRRLRGLRYVIHSESLRVYDTVDPGRLTYPARRFGSVPFFSEHIQLDTVNNVPKSS